MRSIGTGIFPQRWTGAVVLFALLACSEATGPADDVVWAHLGLTCAASDPAVRLAQEKRDAMPPPGPIVTQDDIWAEITPRVPGGWGGSYYAPGHAEQRLMTLWLVDPTRLGEAVDTLRAIGHGIHPAATSFRAERGRWTFLELYEWYRYINTHAYPPGLTFTDINEGRNRLEYGVYPADAVETMLGHLAGLGVPCWLAAVVVKPPPEPAGR